MVQEMRWHAHEDHAPGDWAYCNLCRSGKLAKRSLHKAKKRQVQWPSTPEYNKAPIKEYHSRTSVDEVFRSMMQYMGSTSRQCAKYYSCGEATATENKFDVTHRHRCHTERPKKRSSKNPLNVTEDVKVLIEPGTYAVTAGKWGEEQEQTHVVRLGQGQVVNLDFTV